MLHFYPIGYDAVMALPLRTFWLMSSNIDRIWAQQDMRTMMLTITAASTQEAVTAYRDRLVIETGNVVKLGEEIALRPVAPRDEVGFAELKRMAN